MDRAGAAPAGSAAVRSDIYALGVVLQKVFTGKRPSADSSHPDHGTEVIA
jgi:hypothetical protein